MAAARGILLSMIVLFTDFGEVGPYVGQVKAVLMREAPNIPIIDLLHDAPMFQARASSYLLASLIDVFPTDVVFLCVVDPGVGSSRAPAVVEADGRRFVGPDNGLFEVVLRRANDTSFRRITWEPNNLSASFHGRDLFAPVAARLAKGEEVASEAHPVDSARRPHWPDDLEEIIYLDSFGNAMTGLRAKNVPVHAEMIVNEKRLVRARTFSDLPEGGAFWYENSSGLVEFAVNQGDATTTLGIDVGSKFLVDTTPGAA
jgi:S-adenosylmethionine hydrolase